MTNDSNQNGDLKLQTSVRRGGARGLCHKQIAKKLL